MPEKLHAKNIVIIDAAMEAAACQPQKSAQHPGCHPERSAQRGVEGSRAATAVALTVDTAGDPSTAHLRCSAQDDSGAAAGRPAHIPTLRSGTLDPSAFAHSTCFEAGYLVAKNAGWRNKRPVIDSAACTGCLQCYMHCPDGTVYKVAEPARGGAPVAIDLDFCKGCGVCAKVCAFGAIAMVPERDESEASA